MAPAKTTATKKASKLLPKVAIAVATIAAKPAAGPETPIFEPDKKPTIIPPIIPAIIPDKGGASEANAIPKQRGNATKNTTIDAGKSVFICLNINKNLN